ncbi:ACT domain-containing protein [Clostridioides difficile]|uniref:ACT domain-containing protein n=7 Tax=Clostridioides difficile TaxID=1496 RepID=UPI000BD9AFCD|nr:ACT domain-containing protein [Clostridioides difficile]PBI25250.1 hypothetical protein BGU63_17955 [Clostridioides difficile]
MENTVYAKLNQGIDSFLRVAMTLRRREVDIQSISMTVDNMNNSGIKLIVNEEKTSLDSVLNHMKKLHDIRAVSYPHLRTHETDSYHVFRPLLEK